MKVLATLTDMVSSESHKEPLRFTAALADGNDLYAFRYAANDAANTLYYRMSGNDLVVVSEPLDRDHAGWTAVPPNHLIMAKANQPLALMPIPGEQRVAAA
jgi:glutamine amidotransferase